MDWTTIHEHKPIHDLMVEVKGYANTLTNRSVPFVSTRRYNRITDKWRNTSNIECITHWRYLSNQ